MKNKTQTKTLNPYQINALSDNQAELLIYGSIGEDWFSDESVTAKSIATQLQTLDVDIITVRINSYGGSVADGLAIFNSLCNHRATITVRIDGVAVSIASLIAMAGDKVEMAESALFMVHAPWGGASGNAQELRDYANVLDGFAKAMASGYQRKTGQTHDTIMDLLTNGADHWYTASEAKEFGFVDQIIDEEIAVAAGFNQSKFAPAGLQHVAASLSLNSSKGKNTMPQNQVKKTEKEIEAAALARENKRQTAISRVFSLHEGRDGISTLLNSCLLDSSITLEQAQNKLLNKLGEGAEPLAGDAWRGDGHAYPGDNSHHLQLLDAGVDALLLRSGVHVEDPHPAAADLRGVSALAMAKICLEHGGRSSRSMSPDQLVQASMTSSDFPLLLSNTAGKSLMTGYESEPSSHRDGWVRESEIEDYKIKSRNALSEAPTLLEVREGGEFKDGHLSEKAETFKLKTYGRILSLSRQMIINDDLEALTRLPQAFGASAARKEADIVYAILTGNPVMSDGIQLFHADHNNLRSGTTLSVVALGRARSAMRKQKGLQGIGFLNPVPRFLIVPASLESEAELLIASLVDPSKQNDVSNLRWIRNLTLVVDPRLDAASETGWYISANPNQTDTLEIAHLAGQRGVFVDSETSFASDTFRLKARLDFTAAAIDHVGLQHNPGV